MAIKNDAVKPEIVLEPSDVQKQSENNADIIPKETENNILNVEMALNDWNAYQKLCKELLDRDDYQQITVKEKDENGKYIQVERRFRKKSAWFKLGRAFNVNTEIVEREDYRHPKTHRVIESYYQVRATLPNGRSVVADASCDRSERGKNNASAHDIRTTAETRATNRAISKLIGAGEVSAEEMQK